MARETTLWIVLGLALAGAWWLVVAVATPLVLSLVVLARAAARRAGGLLCHAARRPTGSGRHAHHPNSRPPVPDEGHVQGYVLADRLPPGEARTVPLGLPLDTPDSPLVDIETTETVDPLLVARVLGALTDTTTPDGHHGHR